MECEVTHENYNDAEQDSIIYLTAVQLLTQPALLHVLPFYPPPTAPRCAPRALLRVYLCVISTRFHQRCLCAFFHLSGNTRSNGGDDDIAFVQVLYQHMSSRTSHLVLPKRLADYMDFFVVEFQFVFIFFVSITSQNHMLSHIFQVVFSERLSRNNVTDYLMSQMSHLCHRSLKHDKSETYQRIASRTF